MKKKICKLFIWIFVLCWLFLTSGCTPLKSNIVVGEWNDNIFTNAWSNVTFELPSDYKVQPDSELGFVPGQKTDFFLVRDDQTANISLIYVNLYYGSQQELTAEEYLNIVKKQLAESKNKNYDFASDFESVVIAGEEYLVLRSTFSFKEASTNGTYYQDGYARKFDDSIIFFLANYSDDAKNSVASFLSSITKTMMTI